MKIALVGQIFEKDIGQGIGKYVGHLTEEIKKSENSLEKIHLSQSQNPVITVFTSFFGNFFEILKKKADIYHFTIPQMAVWSFIKKPSIVTIYDLISFTLKEERKNSFNIYFNFMLNFIKKADHFIAISESTKEDLMKFLNIPEDKISVILLGVDHKQFYPLKKKEKNDFFTIGYIGGLGKRKNVESILKIAKEFEGNKKVFFKIAGKGPEKERLEKIAKKMNLNNVEFVGFIPDEKINLFYNSLDIFLFPSLYEGFGLPVLEAMACGTPVVTSNVSSLPEIVGDAGILINPREPKDAVEKIKKLLKDKGLQKEMKEKGLKNAARFNWEKTAKETIKVYNKIKRTYG